MRQGQVGVPTFVYAVGILIVLVAFLFMVPSFKNLLFEAGEKGECQWNVLVSALTRTPGLGFENIPVECKAKYLDVSLADLQANYPEASRAIKKYKAEQKNPAYNEIRKKFNDPNSEAQLAEWSANKIVADEMVDCWDKVWKGELPLFDVWYKLIDYENVVSRKDISQIKYDANLVKQGAGTVSPMLGMILNILPIDIDTVIDWTGDLLTSDPKTWSEVDYLKFWNLKYQRPPVFCVVCTRINFKKDTKSALTSLQIDLTEWLKVNQVPLTKESYTAYLIPDELKGTDPDYKYDINNPVAIVYTRINIQQIAAVTEDVADFLGMNPDDPRPNRANKIAVVPYDKVIMPLKKGGTSCDYVLD